MAIPRPIVDEIRARTDIVELIGRTVTLRRAGRSYSGLCPFHNEKSPSFNVVPDKGIFHCFGCGEGGDCFAFLMKSRGVSFAEAVKELGDACGVVVEERELSQEERQRLQRRADLHDVTEAASRWFAENLLARPEGQPAREYLASRGITTETAQKYRLGFAPDSWDGLAGHLQRHRFPAALALGARVLGKSDRSDRVYDLFRNRLIFPILDDRGRVVAFGGRLMPGGGDGPKYLNSPESDIYNKSRTLYGLSWARMSIQRKDRVIFVEGYFDAVSLWQGGFEEAVATCGTSLTPGHLEVVAKLTKKAVALFDTDKAGVGAAVKSLSLFLDAGMDPKRLELPGAKDPDEFIQKNGPDAFTRQLDHAAALVDILVFSALEKAGNSAAGRARALAEVMPLYRRLPRNIQDQVAAMAADRLGLRYEELLEQMRAEAPPPAAPGPTSVAPPAKWVPSRELSHLFWLLIHFPTIVAPVVAEVEDPALLSDRRSVLEAIVALAGGAPLAQVADPGRDPDLARALRAIASRPAEYSEQTAQAATRQLLARLELSRVEAEILTINAKMAACQMSDDKSSYRALRQAIFALNQRQAQLKSIVAGRSARTASS